MRTKPMKLETPKVRLGRWSYPPPFCCWQWATLERALLNDQTTKTFSSQGELVRSLSGLRK